MSNGSCPVDVGRTVWWPPWGKGAFIPLPHNKHLLPQKMSPQICANTLSGARPRRLREKKGEAGWDLDAGPCWCHWDPPSLLRSVSHPTSLWPETPHSPLPCSARLVTSLPLLPRGSWWQQQVSGTTFVCDDGPKIVHFWVVLLSFRHLLETSWSRCKPSILPALPLVFWLLLSPYLVCLPPASGRGLFECSLMGKCPSAGPDLRVIDGRISAPMPSETRVGWHSPILCRAGPRCTVPLTKHVLSDSFFFTYLSVNHIVPNASSQIYGSSLAGISVKSFLGTSPGWDLSNPSPVSLTCTMRIVMHTVL